SEADGAAATAVAAVPPPAINGNRERGGGNWFDRDRVITERTTDVEGLGTGLARVGHELDGIHRQVFTRPDVRVEQPTETHAALVRCRTQSRVAGANRGATGEERVGPGRSAVVGQGRIEDQRCVHADDVAVGAGEQAAGIAGADEVVERVRGIDQAVQVWAVRRGIAGNDGIVENDRTA